MTNPRLVLSHLEIQVLKDLANKPPQKVRYRLQKLGFDPDNVFTNICMTLGVNNLIGAALIAYHFGIITNADIGLRHRVLPSAKPKQPELTSKQIEVLRWRYEGKKYCEIAELLKMSQVGVRSLLQRTQQVLGVKSFADAVTLGHTLGYY